MSNIKILFVVPGDSTNASTRYRILNILPYLEEEGFYCNVLSLEKIQAKVNGFSFLGKMIFAIYLLYLAPRYDIVYIHRLWFPSIYLKVFIALVDNYIYDFDDALYTSPRWKEVDDKRKERLNHMINQASLVVTGSQVLAEYASQFTDQVRCLPTSLPQKKYIDKRKEWKTAGTQPNITVGWIGNSPNLRYLATIENPLKCVLNNYEDVELLIITAKERALAPLEDRDDVTYRKWSLEKELDYLSRVDIVIRPLINDEWTRGKGGFTSVVQSMALGVPVVVTPVAILEDLVVHGESGFHATTDEEWVQYLSTLIEYPGKCAKMGDEAAETIHKEELWAEKRAEELIELFNRITQPT